MKVVSLMCGLLLLGRGAVMAVETESPRRFLANDCGSVCELRAQDRAFALVIEAYREFRIHQIQADYEVRLRGAAELNKLDTDMVISTPLRSAQLMQKWIKALALKERDLHLTELDVRLAHCHLAYEHLHHLDEAEAGVTVANTVDSRAAADTLRRFIVVAPGSLSSAAHRPVQSAPGLTVLLDHPPAIAEPPQPLAKSAPPVKPEPAVEHKVQAAAATVFQSAILP